MDPRSATLALSVLFVLMWSSGFIGAVWGLAFAGTFTLLFWRYVVVTAVLLALVLALRQRQRLSARTIAHHALIGVLAHAIWLVTVLLALDRGVSPGAAAFVTALQPIVTAALAGPVLKEPVSARQWIGLALGLSSVALVVGDQVSLGGSLAAHMLPFVAVVAISAASILDRRASGREVHRAPMVVTTAIHATASLLVIAPLAGLAEGFEATLAGGLVFAVLWLALVVSLAAFGLMFILLRRMEATRVASLMYLSPPTTMVLAWATFGTPPDAADIAGLAMAAVAVALASAPRGSMRAG